MSSGTVVSKLYTLKLTDGLVFLKEMVDGQLTCSKIFVC